MAFNCQERGRLMAKKNRRTLAAVLALAAAAVYQYEKKNKEEAETQNDTAPGTYHSYTSFGDSIAAGFSLEGYDLENSPWNEVTGSYPSMLREDLHISKEDYAQLAHIAFRTSEVRLVLDDSYEPDAVTKMVHDDLSEDVNVENLRSKREFYDRSVRNADLITIGLGSNDLMLPLMLALFQIAGGSTKPMIDEAVFTQFKQKAAELGSPDAMRTYIFSALKKVNITGGQVKALLGALINGYKGFKDNYNYILKYVYSLNPDAKVVVVGLYNPLRTMQLTDKIPLKLGWVPGMFINAYNLYLKRLSPYADKTKFVDVKDTEVCNTFNVSDIAGTKEFAWTVIYAVHPTAKGHAYIEKQVLKAL